MGRGRQTIFATSLPVREQRVLIEQEELRHRVMQLNLRQDGVLTTGSSPA